MIIVALVLYVFALVCFVVASFSPPLPRIQLGWLGAAFYAAATIATIIVAGLPVGRGF